MDGKEKVVEERGGVLWFRKLDGLFGLSNVKHVRHSCHYFRHPQLYLSSSSGFYVLGSSEIISGRVPTCDSMHSWRFNSAVPLGDQPANTMIGQSTSHIILTLSQPVLYLSK